MTDTSASRDGSTGRPVHKLQWLRHLRGVKMPRARFRVLMAVFDYASGDGTNAHPGLDNLTADACMDRRTVQRHLRDLVDTRWLIVQRRGGIDGRKYAATTYRLGMGPAEPVRDDTETGQDTTAGGDPRGGNSDTVGEGASTAPTDPRGGNFDPRGGNFDPLGAVTTTALPLSYPLKTSSLSRAAAYVADVLGLDLEDERLIHLDQKLAEDGIDSPEAYVRRVRANDLKKGTSGLEKMLDDAAYEAKVARQWENKTRHPEGWGPSPSAARGGNPKSGYFEDIPRRPGPRMCNYCDTASPLHEPGCLVACGDCHQGPGATHGKDCPRYEPWLCASGCGQAVGSIAAAGRTPCKVCGHVNDAGGNPNRIPDPMAPRETGTDGRPEPANVPDSEAPCTSCGEPVDELRAFAGATLCASCEQREAS